MRQLKLVFWIISLSRIVVVLCFASINRIVCSLTLPFTTIHPGTSSTGPNLCSSVITGTSSKSSALRG